MDLQSHLFHYVQSLLSLRHARHLGNQSNFLSGYHVACSQILVFLIVDYLPNFRSGFRCLYVYDSKDLSKEVAFMELEASPATLMLFYDEGSSTVFATGKVNQSKYLI